MVDQRDYKEGASEKRTVEDVLAALEVIEERHVPVLLRRLRRGMDLRPGADVLELGAAQGTYLTALAKQGFNARGVEPWAPAIEVGRELSKRTGIETDITLGRGVTFPLLALGLGALALGCGIALPRQALILGVAVLLGDLAHPRGNDHLRLRHGE